MDEKQMDENRIGQKALDEKVLDENSAHGIFDDEDVNGMIINEGGNERYCRQI